MSDPEITRKLLQDYRYDPILRYSYQPPIVPNYQPPIVPNNKEVLVRHNGTLYRIKFNKYGEIISKTKA